MVQKTLVPRKVTREELNSLVDRAADLIRTAVDYKFILVLLFLKRLNDVWENEKQQGEYFVNKKIRDQIRCRFVKKLKEKADVANKTRALMCNLKRSIIRQFVCH